MLVESSEKYDEQFYDIFSKAKAHVRNGDVTKEIQINIFRSDKNPLVPSLEVADFIAHTGGSAARASLRGAVPMSRPDAAIVFAPPEPFGQYMRIDEMSAGRTDRKHR